MLELRYEAEAMHAMRHPNIVQLYGASLRPPHMCLVLEFATHGSLHDVLKREQSPLQMVATSNIPISQVWVERYNFAADAATGLMYLYSRKVLHRDVKSPNVLVLDTFSRRVAKLADFGLAVVKDESSTLATVSSASTTNWKAPELFRKAGRATVASDMYAFACVLYELAAGQTPWAGEAPGDIAGMVALGERPDIPPGYPDGARELILAGWAQQLEDRLTFEAAVERLHGLGLVEAVLMPEEIAAKKMAEKEVKGPRLLTMLPTSRLWWRPCSVTWGARGCKSRRARRCVT